MHQHEIDTKEGIQEGIEEGFRKGGCQVIREEPKPSLQTLLEIKFGEKSPPAFREIEFIDRIEILRERVRAIKGASTVEEVRRFVRSRRRTGVRPRRAIPVEPHLPFPRIQPHGRHP